jgi:progesterone-induced-blocking factor 1
MGKAKDRLERLLDELNKDARGDDGDTDDTDATPSTVSGVTEAENEVEAIRRMAAAREGRDPDDGPHLGRLEMKVAQRTAKLEERLAILVEENVKKDERHLEAMVAKEKAFDAERQKMLDAVNHLKAKQTELERLAPPLREAIAEAKNDVQSVVCSQERLKELKTMDAKDLSLREFCVLRVHEETASLRADLDITRVERDAARDAASRAKLDNERAG